MKDLSSLHQYRRVLLLAALLLAASPAGWAQTQNVGIGTTTPHAKAALEIVAGDKGLLIPRMDSVQRVQISTPPQGLLVYQTNGRAGLWYFQAGWQFLKAGNQADNLGNHTATRALDLQAQALTGTGDSIGVVGVGIRADGGLNLGQHDAGKNILLGFQAGRSNSGGSNLLVGYQSGWANTTGSGNLFFGYQSGYANTSGNKNFFSGTNAGYSNTTGSSNTFVGHNSGFYSSTGSSNLFVGNAAGIDNQTGSNNMFVGFNSGSGNLTGSNNLAFGQRAGFTADGLTNAGAIGYNARVGQSNALALGGTGADAISVGIGTPTPTATLDVVGTARLRGLPTAGVVTADATGNLSSTPATTLDVTTASNGLTKTGSNFALGGTLAQNTTLTAGANALNIITGGYGGLVNDINILTAPSFGWGSSPNIEQTFSPSGTGQLVKVTLLLQGPRGAPQVTLQVLDGTTVLATVTQAVNTEGAIDFVLPTPITLTAGQLYTLRVNCYVDQFNSIGWAISGVNPYPGGQAGGGPLEDRLFSTTMRMTTLPMSFAGGLGVGTATPSASLDVAGSVRLRTLAAGVVMSDMGGNLTSQPLSTVRDNMGDHTATMPLRFNANDGDKVWLLQSYGANGSKLAHSAGWNVDYYAGPNSAANGNHRFFTGRVGGWTERLQIANNGNVGIGTSAPSALLDVNGTARLRSLSTAGVVTTDALGNLSSATAAALDPTTAGNGLTKTGTDFRLGGTLAAATTIVQAGNNFNFTGGRIGIGTTSPAVPLDVQTANGNLGAFGFAFYAYTGTTTNVGAFAGTPTNISIRAAGRVVAAEFNATSDRRLKNVLGLSDNAADLALLRRLRITDYMMRDRAQFGDRPFKKVIAQEVEEVFPQAVQRQTGFLPDVYAVAETVVPEADSLVRLTVGKALPDVQPGQRVKLLGPGGEVVGSVVRADGRTLVVRGIAALRSERDVFVYGFEHADVRTVDYEALSMLNVSATQELARQLEALRRQQASADTEAEHLRRRLDVQQATLQTLQAQLARLLGEAAPRAEARHSGR